MNAKLPAAVVIGGDLNALSVCRNLGQQGIRTYVLCSHRFEAAGWTRYARRVLARGMYGDRLIESLRMLPEDVGERPVLIVTGEMSLLTISERRQELIDRFRLQLPSHQTLLTLQDKVRFQEFAQIHGLSVPRGEIVRSTPDMARLRNLSFPLILKPADKRHVHLHRVPRLIVVRNQAQADRACRVFLDHGVEIVAQQWVEGSDSAIHFCLFYRGDEQTIMFAGQKLASCPPGSGSTALCTRAAKETGPALMAATDKFLAAVPDYRGFGSVEFKWDSATRNWLIIEPTVGRTDWQEEVASLFGVNLPFARYLCECDRPLPRFAEHDENLIWQSSFIERWKVGPVVLPANAIVVDGFWRRDDPGPGVMHYPGAFLYSMPALITSLSKRMAAVAGRGWAQWRRPARHPAA